MLLSSTDSILPNCLSAAELAEMNAFIDSCEPIKPNGEWYENVQVQSYYANRPLEGEVDDGANLQHVFEAGPVFERAIDHPSWMPTVQHYLGDAQASIHEMFINVRGPGGHITIHGGGPKRDGTHAS